MNKPSLIILPGWGGNRQTWNEFIYISERFFNVYCIELPCFGNEPCPEDVWGIEQYAEFVKKNIEKIKGDIKDNNSEIILLGHSFGGQVATYLAVYSSELIDKLILTGAAISRPKKRIKRLIFNILAKVGKLIFRLPLLRKLEFLAKKVLYRAAKSPDYQYTSETKRKIFKKVIRQDLKETSLKIKAPTLLVWGEDDSYVPLKKGKEIAKLIPNSKLEIIKGGRHGLHIQAPKKLLEIIKNFSKK